MMSSLLYPLLAASASPTAQLEEPLPRPEPPRLPFEALNDTSRFTGELLNMLFMLALLVGAMLLVAWLLNRFAQRGLTRYRGSGAIQVLESRALSAKSALYLIEFDQRRYLLGESQNGLEKLAESEAKSSDFREILERKEQNP